MESLNVLEYNLKGVKGKIHTIREVIILPFTTIVVKGIVNVMTHSKCVTVVVQPVMGYLYHITMARSCGVFIYLSHLSTTNLYDIKTIVNCALQIT